MLKNELCSKGEIFFNYALNFINNEEDIIVGLENEEQNINYDNFVFKLCDHTINNFDLLKGFGTLHNLLINLLNKKTSIKKGNKNRKK